MAGAALAQSFGPPAPGEPVLTAVQVPNLPLGVVTFPNGKAMNLTVALGSGAFRSAQEPPGRLWLVTDHGPSIACAEAKRLIGVEPEAACGGGKAGRISALPGYVPSIYGVEIGGDFSARITAVLPLKGKSGRPVSGRSMAAGSGPKSDPVFAADGKPLPSDPSGLDPTALVRLADGRFWLADSFGPSLVEVGADGTVLRRLVPAGSAEDFKDADYEIVPALPGILRNRRAGQGLQGLALSPDEQFLYVAMQGPLALPDEAGVRESRHLRLFKLERATGALVAEYLYPLDASAQFGADQDGRPRTQADVRVVEMAAVGPDKLIVLEQIEKSSRFFMVALEEGARVSPDLDRAQSVPSLETLDEAGLVARGIRPLTKALVLESDRLPGLPARIEAFAVLSPNELVAINDNDFGIDGARTQMFRITLPAWPADKDSQNGKPRSTDRK